MLLVVLWRIITHLFFQPRERELVANVADVEGSGFKAVTVGGKATGEFGRKDEPVQIGWMTEAKDWAG